MRLGDLDEALRMIKDSKSDNPFVGNVTTRVWEMAHDSAISCVEATPTIDAVPVVRCSECVLSENCTQEDIFRLVAGIENPFCCVGKRKDGEG